MEIRVAQSTSETTPILAHCHNILHQLLLNGYRPLMYIMSPVTHKIIIDSLPKPEPKRTWWQKALRLKGEEVPMPPHLALNGVPIVPNEFMPPGMIHLQAMAVLGPQGSFLPCTGHIPDEYRQNEVPAQPQSQQTPFWNREPVNTESRGAAPARPLEQAPTMSDLADEHSDRPSPTSILIKAMDMVDRAKHIAVLMIDARENVHACTNMDSTTLGGAIQKFQIWHVTGGN